MMSMVVMKIWRSILLLPDADSDAKDGGDVENDNHDDNTMIMGMMP